MKLVKMWFLMKPFGRLITENEKSITFPTGLVATFIRAQEEQTDYALCNRGGHACNILPFKDMAPIGVVV